MRKATLIALGISLIAGTAMAQDPSGLSPSNAPTRTGNSGPATMTRSAPVQAAPMAAPMGSAAPMASSAMPPSSREMRRERRMRHREARARDMRHRGMGRTTDASLDRGATTPDVNRAYMGGGVILEGAPGAPAPMPMPTPPGQRPANMVP